MKRKCILIGLLGLSLALSACGGSAEKIQESDIAQDSSVLETKKENETGEVEIVQEIPTACMVDYGTHAAAGDDGWIYFRGGRKSDNHYSLKKMRPDGSEITVVLQNCNPWYMTVKDGWIYYSESRSRIYKVRTDGTDLTKLNEATSEYLNLAGDWIYYINRETGMISKIRTDGTENTEIIETFVGQLEYCDGWLYYVAYDDGEYALCRVKEDGTEFSKIFENFHVEYAIDSEWIYMDGTHKMKHDGSELTQIGEKRGLIFAFTDDAYYFTNQDALYRKKMDGDEIETVVDGEVLDFTIVGDWIFYYDGISEGMYMIPKEATDGVGAVQV